MSLREVLDVDVVADAGAVRGRVVVTEDLGALAGVVALEDHRDQVEDAGVGELGGRGARHVEVAQAGGGDAVRPARGAHQPLPGQLGLAVGAQRLARGVLGDQVHVGHAVDGGGGGEEEVADARVGHGLEQDGKALHVLVVVVHRLLDGLADLLLARQVHHAGDLVLADDLLQGQPVEDGTDHQRNALRYAVLVARGEVVEDDDLLPREPHRADDVRADVSGATGDQKRHVCLLGPVRLRDEERGVVQVCGRGPTTGPQPAPRPARARWRRLRTRYSAPSAPGARRSARAPAPVR